MDPSAAAPYLPKPSRNTCPSRPLRIIHRWTRNTRDIMQHTDTLDRYTPYALAALRIVTALIFMEHGTQKLFGFPAPPESGQPPLLSLFGIGAVMEFFGGLLILVGLFTRPVAFLLAGEMAVAYWMFHAPRSFYPVLNGGDAAILYCIVFLLLVFTGPGAWSVDGARAKAGPRHALES
jgi:putative oxidoreductase